MSFEFIPAPSAVHNPRQTDERLRRGRSGTAKDLQKARREIYMWDTVKASESEVKGQQPVDPFLSKVFDDEEQATEKD
jgi:hypothetical protein